MGNYLATANFLGTSKAEASGRLDDTLCQTMVWDWAYPDGQPPSIWPEKAKTGESSGEKRDTDRDGHSPTEDGADSTNDPNAAEIDSGKKSNLPSRRPSLLARISVRVGRRSSQIFGRKNVEQEGSGNRHAPRAPSLSKNAEERATRCESVMR